MVRILRIPEPRLFEERIKSLFEESGASKRVFVLFFGIVFLLSSVLKLFLRRFRFRKSGNIGIVVP